MSDRIRRFPYVVLVVVKICFIQKVDRVSRVAWAGPESPEAAQGLPVFSL